MSLGDLYILLPKEGVQLSSVLEFFLDEVPEHALEIPC